MLPSLSTHLLASIVQKKSLPGAGGLFFTKAVAALTVTAVETFASVVAVATADGDGDGDGSQNRVTTKVSCNEEGGGDGGKSDGNKGGRGATTMTTTWALVTATRLAGDKEGKCKGGKGNCGGDKGRWRWRQQLMPFQRWQQRQQWLWR
jgi:hypothetical protein